MKQSVLTFTKGMNTDLDNSVLSKGTYRYALNLRLGNYDSSSSENIGTLENVIGNSEKIDFSEAIYSNLGAGITLSNMVVYKVTTLKNKLVFFVTYDYTEDSILYEGANGIFYLEVAEDGTFGDVTIAYSYYDAATQNVLNFHYELSVVSRYETSTVQKVYWANGTDPLRAINILEDNSSLELDQLDHVPSVEFSNIENIEIVSGGTYNSGIVQYAYQLYNLNGSITTISPVSNPIQLSSFPEDEVGGSAVDEDTNKSVSLEINSIDSRFNRIRVIALFYKRLFQNPEVNIVYEGVNTGSLSLVDTGNILDTLTYEEFLTFNSTSYIPKEIETKDNILFSANVTEATFKSEAITNWDSRAYIFTENDSSTDITVLEGGTQVTYADWNSVPETSDALSPGSASGGFEEFNLHYKSVSTLRAYQYNSSILGGEGPNIKFEYKIQRDIIENKSYQDELNLKPSKNRVTGLQPNEVYRFGIVFYNSKGQVSFVKHIQDVRVPYVELIDNTKDTFGTDFISGSNRTFANHVNVEFTIKNMPNDPNITSWQIVRAKRGEEDREVLYNGYYYATSSYDSGENFNRPWIALDGSGLSDATYYSGLPLESKYYVSGGGDEDHVLLWEFLTPEVNFNKEVKNLSSAKCLVNNYMLYSPLLNEIDRHSIAVSKYYNSEVWPEDFIIKDISDYELAVPGIYNSDLTQGRTYILGSTDKEKLINVSRGTGGTNFTDNIGVGGTKLIINSDLFDSTTPGSGENGFPDTGWDLVTDGKYYRTLYGQIVRDVSNSRYGGITYSARQLTEYIPYGKINDVATLTDQTVEFNGDTFIKMFVYLRNIAQEDYPIDWGDEDGLQEILAMPVHSSIDLDYRSDDIFKYATLEPTTGTGALENMWIQETVELGVAYQPEFYDEDIGDLYTYNSVYSKQNEAKKFYPKPFDFEEETTIDNKVIASEKKINGESIDSWFRYKPSNFIEVDPRYGSINVLKHFNNSLFFYQDKAFGVLAVNDRSLIRDNNLSQLALGTGGVLERYDYVATNIGCSSNISLDDSDSAMYWYDKINHQLIEYSDRIKYLDLEKGIRSYILDIPEGDAIVTIDHTSREVLFSFPNNNTIAYSQMMQAFCGEYSFTPSITFIGFDNELYSMEASSDKVYIHNEGNRGEFYGIETDSELLLVCNEDYDYIKAFDTLGFPSRALQGTTDIFDDTFDTLQVYNNYQNSDEYNLVKGDTYDSSTLPLGRRERVWTTHIPRNAVNKDVSTNPDIFDPANLDKTQKFKGRMRDNHLNIKMTYDNSSGNKFYIPYVKISYRYSKI